MSIEEGVLVKNSESLRLFRKHHGSLDAPMIDFGLIRLGPSAKFCSEMIRVGDFGKKSRHSFRDSFNSGHCSREISQIRACQEVWPYNNFKALSMRRRKSNRCLVF